MINSGRLARAECARRAWGRAQRCTRDATRGMESPNCPEAASPDEAGGANSAAPLCTQLAEHLGGSHGCTLRAMLTRTTRRLVLYVPEAQGAQGPAHCTYAVRLLAWGVPYEPRIVAPQASRVARRAAQLDQPAGPHAAASRCGGQPRRRGGRRRRGRGGCARRCHHPRGAGRLDDGRAGRAAHSQFSRGRARACGWAPARDRAARADRRALDRWHLPRPRASAR